MNDNIDWKDVAHYGSAIACLAMAGLTELGVTLPGVTVDPKLAAAAGIGILGAGLKGGTKAAILLPLLAVLSSPALAADVSPMPVKAPVFKRQTTPCTPTMCSGWDAGVELAGVGGSADILGGGLSALTQNGGLIGATVGYKVWNGSIYFGAHVSGDYQVNVNAPAGSVLPRWLVTETVDLGVGLGGLIGSTTATAVPTQNGSIPALNLPSTILASFVPFLRTGAAQRDQLHDGWLTGGGGDFIIAQNWNLRATIEHISYNGGAKEDISKLGILYHF